MLEMQSFADRLAKGFSQGQKLKTALARALVHRPRNVLLDEPTNGLDVMAVRNLRKLLGQLRDAGHCVLFSSHVMQEVEQLCDEVVVINGGQVVAAGTLADIRARAANSHLEDAFVSLMHGDDAGNGDAQVNLRGIWAVFRKEFRENLRDKRTLLSALVFGPVISPILVAGLVQFGISHAETQSDENISVAVTHAESAPNLIDYLSARGVNIEKVNFDEAAARNAVATQTHKIILEIPDGFRHTPAGRVSRRRSCSIPTARAPSSAVALDVYARWCRSTASRSRSCASWRAASIRFRCCRFPCRRSTCRRPPAVRCWCST